MEITITRPADLQTCMLGGKETKDRYSREQSTDDGNVEARYLSASNA
jgi:hypothetical protein